ncbi:MAG: rod shape-determining protein MreD [Chlamydiota bacterium]|nr:rod shape-determining protein MreD [Chlamydiota bacterium]
MFKYICLVIFAVIASTQTELPIDFLGIACVYVALRRGKKTVGIVCIVGGIFENILSGGPLGLRSLTLMLACWIICSVTHLIYKEHITTKFGSVLMGVLCALVLEWIGLFLMDRLVLSGLSFGHTVLPLLIGSAFAALPIIALLDWFFRPEYERWNFA